MIRTTSVPRQLRVGAALAGVAGIVALAGCATPAEDGTTSPEVPAADTQATPGGDTATGGGYADGTYTADGSYRTPETTETIEVTITLADDIVTAVDVTGDPQAPQSQQYQSQFIGGIADEVVGRDIDDLTVDRVAGSSLTSGGFNDALEQIKAEAAG
jgi:uncharacterized protein with FMN-binding domain